MLVMARMREDESRLRHQIKRLIKDKRSLAIQIISTEIDGWTPIHACALRGTLKLLKIFLSTGVDVNIRMGQPEGLPGGCTILHMACLRGDVDRIEYLLSEKANIEAQDSNQMTPVMYAAKRKHRRSVKLLEDRGANMVGVELPVYECFSPQPRTAKFCFF